MANNTNASDSKASDPTISRNKAPNTDDSVLEAIDETTPGVSQPVVPERGKTPHADKAA